MTGSPVVVLLCAMEIVGRINNVKARNQPRSGESPLATGFSRWTSLLDATSAVGTTDLSSLRDSKVECDRNHRLKPVVIEVPPLRGWGSTEKRIRIRLL